MVNLDLLYGFVTAAQLSEGLYTPNDLWDVETSNTSQSLTGSVSAAASGGFVDVPGSANVTSGTGFLAVEVTDAQLGAANVENDFSVNVQGPPAPLPDLVVQSNGLNASELPVGGNLQISWAFQNLGNAAAPASQMGVYFCDSTVFSPANVKYSFDVSMDALTPQEYTTGTFNFTLPTSLGVGTYYVFLKANDNGAVIESNTGNDLSSWSELTINPPALFHASPADNVNFNYLTADQIFAIENGANKYAGLGGDDVVVLPDEAHENYTLPGTSYQFLWYDSLASQFETQTLAGQHATVRGNDGNYYIQLGAGDDTVNISNTTGRISRNVVVCGSGHDYVNIHGANADNGITSGNGPLTLNIDGYGNNKLQLEGGAPGAIYGTVATAQNPYIANNGSFTFQFLLDGVDTFNGTLAGDGEVNVFGGQLAIARDQSGFTGEFTLQQGTLELTTPGGAGSGHIVFENNIGGDILQIDGTAMPKNVIDGFTNQQHQRIDLRGVAFTGNGSAKISTAGALTVTPNIANAGGSYTLNLDPNYDYSALTPVLYDDGAGGTMIDYAQVVRPADNVQATFSLAWLVFGRVHLSIAPLDAIAVIAAGGTSATTTVEAGGRMIVTLNGRAVTGLIQAGGSETDYGRDINSATNGKFSVMGGGFASGLTVSQGGLASISIGGKLANSLIGSQGSALDSGRVIVATVDSSGKLTIASGGFAANVGVQTGGSVDLQAGGRALATNVGAGGSATVEGRAVNHVVAGSQTIEAGGFSAHSEIQGGGQETVESGGKTADDVIAGSLTDYGRVLVADVTGSLTVAAGGFIATTAIENGGSLLVESGAVGRDLNVAGGALEVQAGGSLVNTLTMTSGLLQLDDTAIPVAPISGFNLDDAIDLRGVAFDSQSSSVGYAANVLSVSDGVHSQSLNLLGAFVPTSFATLSDGHGGVLVELAGSTFLGAPRLPGS